MRVGIVIPVYSGYPERLFASVEGQTRNNVQWYLHCNRRDRELEADLTAFSRRASVKLELHGWNRGVSISWNAGILASRADGNDLTIVMNDDVHFVDGGFDKFVEFLATHPEQGYGLAFVHGRETAGGHSGEERSQGFACFAHGRAAHDRIGAFDENFYPAYCEDIDYALRVRHSGLSIIIDERVLVEHARNKSTRDHADLRVDIEPMKAENLAYYDRKWGSPKLHERPFRHAAFDYKIDWARRHAPYGLFDRALDFTDPTDEAGIIWSLQTIKLRVLASQASEAGVAQDEGPHDETVIVPVSAHIANRGDVTPGADGWGGSETNTLAMEGFKLEMASGAGGNIISYRARNAEGEWSRWHLPGQFCGSKGRGMPLTGIEFRLAASRGNACLHLRTVFAGSSARDASGDQQVVSSSADRRPLVGVLLRIETRAAMPQAAPADDGAIMEMVSDA